ncbi:MAG: hypothetical protein HC933_09215 [Pleurocapsa sp. SU_196_0]|nr:hypothetical protein [Pleurocapsa sp. SU_196_0]
MKRILLFTLATFALSSASFAQSTPRVGQPVANSFWAEDVQTRPGHARDRPGVAHHRALLR